MRRIRLVATPDLDARVYVVTLRERDFRATFEVPFRGRPAAEKDADRVLKKARAVVGDLLEELEISARGVELALDVLALTPAAERVAPLRRAA
jgi:hypothetical protein